MHVMRTEYHAQPGHRCKLKEWPLEPGCAYECSVRHGRYSIGSRYHAAKLRRLATADTWPGRARHIGVQRDSTHGGFLRRQALLALFRVTPVDVDEATFAGKYSGQVVPALSGRGMLFLEFLCLIEEPLLDGGEQSGDLGSDL